MPNPARLVRELIRARLEIYRDTLDLPPWTGQTLDKDDADIAMKWLKRREAWELAGRVTRYELPNDPGFQNQFIRAMNFPERTASSETHP